MHHIFCQNKLKARERLQKIYENFKNNPQSFLKLLNDELSQCSECLKEYLILDIDKNIEKQRILYKFYPEKIYDWELLFDNDIFNEYKTFRNFPDSYKGFKAIIFLLREKTKSQEIWDKIDLSNCQITQREVNFFKSKKLKRNSTFYKALRKLISTFPEHFGAEFFEVLNDAFNCETEDINERTEVIIDSFQAFKELSVFNSFNDQYAKAYYLYFLEKREISLIVENQHIFTNFNLIHDVLNQISTFNSPIMKFLLDHLDDANFDNFYKQGSFRNLISFIPSFDFNTFCLKQITENNCKVSKLFLRIVLCTVKNKNDFDSDLVDLIRKLNIRKCNDLAYPLLYLRIFLQFEINLIQFTPKAPMVHILLSIISGRIAEEKYCHFTLVNKLIDELEEFKPYIKNFQSFGIQISNSIRADPATALRFIQVFESTHSILENLANNLVILAESLKAFIKVLLRSNLGKSIIRLRIRAINEFKSKEIINIIESYITKEHIDNNILTQTANDRSETKNSFALSPSKIKVVIKNPMKNSSEDSKIASSNNNGFISIKKKDSSTSNFTDKNEYEGSYFQNIDHDKLEHLKGVLAKNKLKNPIKEAIILDRFKSDQLPENTSTSNCIDSQPIKYIKIENDDEIIPDKDLGTSKLIKNESNISNYESLNCESNKKLQRETKLIQPYLDTNFTKETVNNANEIQKNNTSISNSNKPKTESLASIILQKSNNIFNISSAQKPDDYNETDIDSFYEESLDPFYKVPSISFFEIPNSFDSYQDYFNCFNPLRSVENFFSVRTSLFEHSEFYQCTTYDFNRFLWIEVSNFKNEIHDLLYFSFNRKHLSKSKPEDLQTEISNGAFLGIVTSITPGFFSSKTKNAYLIEIRVSKNIKNIPKKINLNYRFVYNIVSNNREYTALKAIKTSKLLKYLLNPQFLQYFYQKKLTWDDKNYRYITADNYDSSIKVEIKLTEDFHLLKDLLFKVHKLNMSQAEAVAMSFYSKDKFFLIQGPPGTGKTTTILSIISTFLFIPSNNHFHNNHKNFTTLNSTFKILVCAPSNTAIDVFVTRLSQGIRNFFGKYTPVNFIRVGVGASSSVNKFTLEHLMNLKSSSLRTKTRHELLKNASIVCTTLSSSGSETLNAEKFNLVIIDEACQATEISSIIPLKFSPDKVILIGDPKQLPPTILSENFQLQKSLFDRLLIHQKSVLLNEQYRMHPEICQLSSSFFYKNQIKTNDLAAIKRRDAFLQKNYHFNPLNFIDISNGNERQDQFKSFYNEKEEEVCISICKSLRLKYGNSLKICILSPYKAQVNRLNNSKNMLTALDVEANTIDSFQGKECDFVILSTVRQKGLGFTCDFRRINVAITRSKLGLIILGNQKCLSKSPIWAGIIQFISENQSLVHIDKLSQFLENL